MKSEKLDRAAFDAYVWDGIAERPNTLTMAALFRKYDLGMWTLSKCRDFALAGAWVK